MFKNGNYVESLHTKGHEALLLRFEGLPAETLSVEIKFIFHLEGTPNISTTTVLMPAVPKPIIGDPVNLERARAILKSKD